MMVRENDGFTQIELMIVMAIILVLCAVAAPSMHLQNSEPRGNILAAAEVKNNNRITPAMLRQQRQETAMILRAVQAELRDEIR